MNIRITGSGSYIPNRIVTNIDFAKHQFLDENGNPLSYSNEVVAEKFRQITGIDERRYVEEDLLRLILLFLLLKKPLKMPKLILKLLDYIIFAHNFGDVKA